MAEEKHTIDITWVKSYIKERQDRCDAASSKEYIDWIGDFMTRRGISGFSDDEFLYDEDKMPEQDYKYAGLLSYFMSHVCNLAKIQGVEKSEDAESSFENVNFTIVIDDSYYLISTYWGQGALTEIKQLLKAPEHKCVIVAPKDANQEGVKDCEDNCGGNIGKREKN